MQTINFPNSKIEVESANKGTFYKLRIVRIWFDENDKKVESMWGNEVIIEFGKAFDNEEEIETFNKTKFFKSIYKITIANESKI